MELRLYTTRTKGGSAAGGYISAGSLRSPQPVAERCRFAQSSACVGRCDRVWSRRHAQPKRALPRSARRRVLSRREGRVELSAFEPSSEEVGSATRSTGIGEATRSPASSSGTQSRRLAGRCERRERRETYNTRCQPKANMAVKSAALRPV